MGDRLALLEPPREFSDAARELADATRRGAVTAELLLTQIARGLTERGVPAMPLKGPVLGRELYGDPGLRPFDDLDLLVRASDLDAAGYALVAFGYALDGLTRWSGGRPLLHHRYVHSGGLPTIELHWRVHWYEERFSGAMLDRAETGGDGAPRARPADELAALLLFYARDGFAGLRHVADIAQWWDVRGHELPAGGVGAVADEFAELRRALTVAAWQMDRLAGVPAATVLGARPALGRAAARAARAGYWALDGPDRQITAAAHLADVLLAPPGGRGAALRRSLILPPWGVRGVPALLAVAAHSVRLGRRWAALLWSTRGGREAPVALPAQPL
jgi:hypothetical protein